MDASPLGRLPAELFLMIIDCLCERHLMPYRLENLTWHYTRHIHSLSLASRQLRKRCLQPLFSSLKVVEATQLVSLENKCTQDPEFAGLIRKLVLSKVESPNILTKLLHRLPSLVWLEADDLNAELLATVNSHHSLKTVAIRDLHILRSLLPSTSLSFSKIRVESAVLNYLFTLQSPELLLLLDRGSQLARLCLHAARHTKKGPGTLSFPGLEELEIRVDMWPRSPMSWLPAFVERHQSLQRIKFAGNHWTKNPDIPLGLRFVDAVQRESLALTVELNAFTVVRSQSSALEDWPVTQAHLNISEPIGLSAVNMVSSLAPQLLTLSLRMPRFGKKPICINDLVSPLSLFPSLRRLELHGMYRHISADGGAEPPWALTLTDPAQKVSECIRAHAALRWVMTRAAHHAPSIEQIYITDEGNDWEGRSHTLWRLKALYRVHNNRDLEVLGTPEFFMAPRYRSASGSDLPPG
ncbi:hypothetical protein DFH06DRAFT_204186 [Mycena polygramma]|nr:hypothetical protein DFH06DRAFT_204186 [Mycena polygramma]